MRLLFAAVTAAIGTTTAADDPLEFFEKRIRPVLVHRCYECHSRATKQKGGLLLDSREDIRRGGDSGHAVIPQDVAGSMLVEAIRYESFEMPPDGRLPDPVVADFIRWIEMGAPDPRDKSGSVDARDDTPATASGDLLWSLQPLESPAVPSVRDRSWPLSDLDHFVLSRLEKQGMKPAATASPLLLCRRLYFTLTGLPPTGAQIDHFLAQVNGAGEEFALGQLVDALLASPHFGERWGRLWLDLARYSDTRFGSEQRPWTNAWLYRNYVIKRFNEDLPFDRFVLEQIAGDMLPASDDTQRADQLVATGFLALAVRDLSERDAFQIQLDGIDDALETIGKSMLGLNLGCARCHDHKFDPIPAADYYAMAGILKSSWLTGIRPRKAIFNGDELIKHHPTTPRIRLPGSRLRTTVVTEFSQNRTEENIGDMAIHLAGSYRRLGAVVPRGFIKALDVSDVAPIPSGESGRRQLAQWLTSRQNPLTPRVIANRLWQWLVGRPLVESVDNFGSTGRPPTYPELLDWLAVRFRDDRNWRFKPMIRDIVLSRSWRMETSTHTMGMAVDPENASHWRMNRRRLEAEQLHDSMLALGDELDHRVIEQTLPDYEQENTTNTSSVKIAPETLRHRAVYFPIFRKDMPMDLDILRLFDFPDPKMARGRRESNTLPAQALFLWNSPLTQRAAGRIAERLMTESSQAPTQRAEQLILWLYVRRPDLETVTQLVTMQDQFQDAYRDIGHPAAEFEAWRRLIHTMLISNEFVFIQ